MWNTKIVVGGKIWKFSKNPKNIEQVERIQKKLWREFTIPNKLG